MAENSSGELKPNTATGTKYNVFLGLSPGKILTALQMD